MAKIFLIGRVTSYLYALQALIKKTSPSNKMIDSSVFS
jgi:hypothetical protein